MCILGTLRVLVGKEALVEYVYVSKGACNCRVWEFCMEVGVSCRRHPYIDTDSLIVAVYTLRIQKLLTHYSYLYICVPCPSLLSMQCKNVHVYI